MTGSGHECPSQELLRVTHPHDRHAVGLVSIRSIISRLQATALGPICLGVGTVPGLSSCETYRD